MTRPTLLPSLLFIAPAAHAQPAVGTMTMTANGQPSATIAPGQTVNLRATVSWTNGPQTGGAPNNNTFAGIAGDMTLSPNSGTPANLTSDFTSGGLVNLGSFVGGSRMGIDMAVTPNWVGGFIIPPTGNSAGIKIVAYDLTLATPGTYTLAWTPLALAPLVRVYPSILSPNFANIPTTYLPATIIVTPTPATLAPLLLLALPRRRR